MSGELVKARANGGYLVHIVDLKTMVALCGFECKNTSRMKRGKWMKVKDGALVSCRKCVEKSPSSFCLEAEQAAAALAKLARAADLAMGGRFAVEDEE